MRSPWRTFPSLLAALIATLVAGGCYEAKPTEVEQSSSAPIVGPQLLSPAALIDHPGRRLAANCFQCHGTDGYAGELKIATMGASEIIGKFDQYRASSPQGDIMNVHALAYTPEQIAAIADYFAKLGQ